MAQPSPYSPQTNFQQYQQSNPAAPFSGSLLDAELVDIATSIDETLANLALIQRDDGQLFNGIVTPDSLNTATINMIGEWNPRGAWATATNYAVLDMVTPSGGDLTYVCNTAHTSGASFAVDLAAGYWQLVNGGTASSGNVQFTTNNVILGRVTSGAGGGEEIACTAFARTILDDADAATVRATIGLGSASDPTFSDLTVDALTIAGLTASTMVYADASKRIVSAAAATNGQLLIGSTGAIPALASLTGTANQVVVTNGAGAITLSLPQSIAPTSSPTFAGLQLSGLSLGSVVFVGGSSALAQDNANLNYTDASNTLYCTNYQYPASPGSVTRNLDEKVGEWPSVLDYGAVGDGVTDDAAAIQAAINGITGDVLTLPAGSYYCSVGITIPAGKMLVGISTASTSISGGAELLFDSSVAVCVTLAGVGGVPACLRDVTINRDSDTFLTTDVGLDVVDCDTASIEGVYVLRHGIGIRISGGLTRYFLSRCVFTKISGTHLWLDDAVQVHITNCGFGKNGAGDISCNEYIRVLGVSDSVYCTSTQFNITAGTCSRMLYFDNYNTPTGVFLFSDGHLDDTCTDVVDATGTTEIQRLCFSNFSISATGDFFGAGMAGVVMEEFRLTGCPFVQPTFVLTDATGGALTGNKFENAFTLDGGSVAVVGNVFNGDVTLTGAHLGSIFSDNAIIDGTETFTNTATGFINVFGNTINDATKAAAMVSKLLGQIQLMSTGARIYGDFTNATRASRAMFQSSTTNGGTNVGAIPNGTSNIAALSAFSSSDPDNSHSIRISVNATQAGLDSVAFGTGTPRALELAVSSITGFLINTSGVCNVAASTATPAAGSTSAALLFGTTAAFGTYYGSGAPTVVAAKGSLYLRSDGSGVNDRMYVATDSAGTWTAVVTVA